MVFTCYCILFFLYWYYYRLQEVLWPHSRSVNILTYPHQFIRCPIAEVPQDLYGYVVHSLRFVVLHVSYCCKDLLSHHIRPSVIFPVPSVPFLLFVFFIDPKLAFSLYSSSTYSFHLPLISSGSS